MGRYSNKFKWLDQKMKKCNWSIKDNKELYDFPYWLLSKVYSQVSMIRYQGRYTRGRVVYLYIPSLYTIDKIPIIVDVIVKLGDPPEQAICISYHTLKQIFKHNKFED